LLLEPFRERPESAHLAHVIALVNSDEGLVTYPIAGAQPEQPELVFMPVIAKPPAQVLDHAAEL